MKLRLSSECVIDSEKEPWCREGLRICNLGGPGSGKSWNNSLFAEQFLTQGGTVVIFQPRDEYYTLKEKFDILSVGGIHAKDMEFALTSPKLYAKAVVEDGISMIFYTSGLEEEKLVGWVSRFIHHLLTLQETHKRPLLIILEEAHEYIPKSPSGHIAPPWVYNRMIKAFKDCFTQGRKLNIIPIVSSQRPQELNFTTRQLANLTFYGKFSDQDIGYVDKECLKYVRKQGIKVEASRLVSLKLGEWLVIQGKHTRFIIVTEKRLTKHGADTPTLEYVAPRAAKTKKTLAEFTKAITFALEKEQSEKSELEQLKRKNRKLEKEIKDLKEKAQIKLSVTELLAGNGLSPEELERRLKKAKQEGYKEAAKEWEVEKKGLEKKLEDMTKKEATRCDQLEVAHAELKPYKRLVEALVEVLPLSNISKGKLPFSKDEIVKEVLSKLPMQGNIVFEVTPLKKIQKNFQLSAKEKLLTAISQLDDQQKKILKFLEAVGKETNLTEILDKALFLSSTSAGNRNRITQKLSLLASQNLIATSGKTSGKKYSPFLHDQIHNLLSSYGEEPTEEEVDVVYNHILVDILNQEAS